ncbi:DUF4192 family protein [Nocardia abscessus]|uniref:DUF4192 family protein n=1 Tax=Nocardia abscessus TaxID=120957 RepID=UPI00030EFD4E|nr:DUF4192 family protein [Nocardia abscessus]MCC3328313.1 DUF4192 domain-containing protein [Nocardia abscessus]
MSFIDDPGRFIAEALARLPEPPHRSLVVMALREPASGPDGYVGVERIRHEDLDRTRHYLATSPILACTRRWCAQHRPDAVAVVVVDGPTPGTPFPRDEYRGLVARFRDQLLELGVGAFAAWAVTGRDPGHPWASLFGSAHGLLPYAPPRADSVEDLPHDLAPDAELAAEVAALVTVRGGDRELSRERLRLALMQVEAVRAEGVLSAAEVAELADALTDGLVRDSLYAFAVSAKGSRGHRLWALLVRALPSPHRTAAAMLCAVTAYVHGDRDRAGAAIGIAVSDDPDNPTVQAVAAGIHRTVPVALFRAALSAGRANAAHLGIDIDID